MPVFPDWYCCVAVALDAEEEEYYERHFCAYIAAGGDPKKFPKRRARRAQGSVDVLSELQRAGLRVPAIKGDVKEYAALRGLTKVYRLEDGSYVDENGQPVVPNPKSIFVPLRGA